MGGGREQTERKRKRAAKTSKSITGFFKQAKESDKSSDGGAAEEVEPDEELCKKSCISDTEPTGELEQDDPKYKDEHLENLDDSPKNTNMQNCDNQQPTSETTLERREESFLEDVLLQDHPYQPLEYNFPKRKFGNSERSLNPAWFSKYSWLHYLHEKDAVICFVCAKAYKQGLIESENCKELTFISEGFRNWKNATEKGKGFIQHTESKCHATALNMLFKYPNSQPDLGEIFSSVTQQQKSLNRKCFLKVLSCIRYLGRQGLALRGTEVDSNFIQLVHLKAEDDPELSQWMKKTYDKHLSGIAQNDIIRIMAETITSDIASKIRNAKYFSILADETTDVSNKEQVVVCLRWIDLDFQVNEDYICLKSVKSSDAKSIADVITDTLHALGIPLEKARGQCYDGCSTMMGKKKGVAQLIKEQNQKCLVTHCYCHALNLACADTIKENPILKDTLENAFEITKLIKKSPKREGALKDIQGRMKTDDIHNAPSIKILCPTRWTVRAQALQAIIDNYEALDELWDWFLENSNDSEMKARVRGVQVKMLNFEFFYGLHICCLVLRHSDKLSATLQSPLLCAFEAQAAAKMTLVTIRKMRSDRDADLFFKYVTDDAEKKNVGPAQLPRRRRRPKRFQQGDADPEFHENLEAYYRQIYFAALDAIEHCISDRFDQPDYVVYVSCEQLLLKALQKQDYQAELERILDFFTDDFDKNSQERDLTTFSSIYEGEVTFRAMVQFIKSLEPVQREIIPSIMTLLHLILVMPATNASSERAFSALRNVKTYLRSTMGQERLDHLMTLYIHKERLDTLDLLCVANRFVMECPGRRLSAFGKFK